MKKFCCDRFKSKYESGKIFEHGKLIKEVYPSIAIVRQMNSPDNRGASRFSFLIVCGPSDRRPPVIPIAYCPFCGTYLFDYYNSDDYVNEDVKTFEH